MFGMLNPARSSLSYRATYSRCCQHHRRVNGVLALPSAGYEAVLLYQAAADAGAVSTADLPRVRCCKLRALPARSADAAVGAFCAHVGTLLASIKVSDDLRDRGSLRSRILSWIYRRRFAATYRYFARHDPDFQRRVEGFIGEHLALENPRSPISLEAYIEPTARAFGYVFALMARLPGLDTRGELLRDLGERVGAAIIAFDCAVDRDRDRRRGEYNPLPDGPGAVADALAFSRGQLTRARLLCESAFGPEALTVQTLTGVCERVANVGRRLACPRCGPAMIGVLQNWGLAQRPGAVRLNSLFGLGGLAALAVGLAVRMMSSAPPPGPLPPFDPNAAQQQPPPIPAAPPASAPSGTSSGSSSGDCSNAICQGLNCCDCGCDVGSVCDGLNCSGCDGCGCDGCGGCDCNC